MMFISKIQIFTTFCWMISIIQKHNYMCYWIFTFHLQSCMGPKKQGFWPRINCSKMNLRNFGSPSGDSLSKIVRHFINKVVLKSKSAKNAFYKKGGPKLIFFKEIFFRNIRMIFNIENSLWKSKIGTFWQTVTRWRLKIW